MSGKWAKQQRRGIPSSPQQQSGGGSGIGLTTQSYDVRKIPASKLDFLATDFKLKLDQDLFYMMFGVMSPFDAAAVRFTHALEVRMPFLKAKECLVDAVWNKFGLNATEHFIDTLSKQLSPQQSQWARSYQCDKIELPLDRSRDMRSFQSVHAFLTLADPFANIEFFKVPTSTLALPKLAREGNEPRSLLNVEMDTRLMYAFLFKTRQLVDSKKME